MRLQRAPLAVRPDGEASILLEFANMHKFYVWEYAEESDPSSHEVIPSKMFLKKKFDASGHYLKLKSRLGHLSKYHNNS